MENIAKSRYSDSTHPQNHVVYEVDQIFETIFSFKLLSKCEKHHFQTTHILFKMKDVLDASVKWHD